jgi:diaminopimelate decarboxylase
MGFSIQGGFVTCESLRVKTIQERVPESPFFLYSLDQLRQNTTAYFDALDGLDARVFYSLKANANPALLQHLRAWGCGATLVSGNELRLAMIAGFEPHQMFFNGNGKTRDELDLAVEYGVRVNVDSMFDLEHIEQAASRSQKRLDILLRINPGIDPQVHPKVSTGLQHTKFGFPPADLPRFLARLRNHPHLNLAGLHVHLGSTIQNASVFKEAAARMSVLVELVRSDGFPIHILNLGGGLGIDEDGRGGHLTPADLVQAVRPYLPGDITLVLEPGRSLIGDAGILVGKVIGLKSNGGRHFAVTDLSMAELIRPTLYSAYHRITWVESVYGPEQTLEIVGPVCESGDFVGKERRLPRPPEGTGVVVFDAGAYGYAMSSNYNMRMRPAEYLVDREKLFQIRRAERLDDHARLFENKSVNF